MTAPQMPMLLVGRHQRHREGGHAHQQQRRNQRGFAADAVAVVTEDRRSHGPRDEAHGIDCEGLQRAYPGVRVRKEQLGEDEAGDSAVKEEIVPFNGGADRGGDDGAAELHLVFGRGELAGGGGVIWGHGRFSGKATAQSAQRVALCHATPG